MFDSRSLKLKIDCIRVVRRGFRVLDDFSCEIKTGQLSAVQGPNGVGKTSLLRAIAGLLPLSQGRISLEGMTADLPVSCYCHFVGHAPAVKPLLTVLENLAFWCSAMGGNEQDLAQVLGQFNLLTLSEVPAAYLSAGQLRRLALARVLCTHRCIWLLDEPTTALDVHSQELLKRVMEQHLNKGGMIVATTHGELPLKSSLNLQLSSVQTLEDEGID